MGIGILVRVKANDESRAYVLLGASNGLLASGTNDPQLSSLDAPWRSQGTGTSTLCTLPTLADGAVA
jgi:hypothetical protein